MIAWYGENFLRMTTAELQKGFTKAGVYFTSKTRGYLNTSQPYQRTKRTGRHIGLAPSRPGEFPRKLSGQLQRSITWTLDKKKLVLTVGSNLQEYPSMLETGTRFMRPRPWLTLAFAKEKNKIGRTIAGR